MDSDQWTNKIWQDLTNLPITLQSLISHEVIKFIVIYLMITVKRKEKDVKNIYYNDKTFESLIFQECIRL